MSKFGKTLIVAALTVFSATSALAFDRHSNPPGPVGGPGTNWHNPPGPAGGPGASPRVQSRAAKVIVVDRHHVRHHHWYRHHARHHVHPAAADFHMGPYR